MLCKNVFIDWGGGEREKKKKISVIHMTVNFH